MSRSIELTLAIIGLLTTSAVSFIPYVGVSICAPLVAACIGVSAGYMGTQRDPNQTKLDAGVIASVLAGSGTLVGSMLFTVLLMVLLRFYPTVFHPIVLLYYAQTSAPINPAQLQSMLEQYAPTAGFCFGVLNLIVAVVCGLLGSWAAAHRRKAPHSDTKV